MSMFVSDTERVPVTVDGVNIIYIRPKMGFGAKQRVAGALARLEETDEGESGMSFDLGAANLVLMTRNIVGWEGPEFRGVPCTPKNIALLDPDESLVNAVLAEIVKRNPFRAASPDDPKEAETSGSATDGQPPSEGVTRAQSATMTPTLRLQTATAGRRKR